MAMQRGEASDMKCAINVKSENINYRCYIWLCPPISHCNGPLYNIYYDMTVVVEPLTVLMLFCFALLFKLDILVHVWVRACVRACVHACVRACVRACATKRPTY